MILLSPAAEQILDVILRKPGCLMEELLNECPALTWNQVFIEVDRLSRDGEVRLMRKGPSQYVVMRGGPGQAHGSVTAAR